MRSTAARSLLALAVLTSPAAALHGDDDSWYLQFGASRTLPADSSGPGGDIQFEDGYGLSAALGTELFHFGRNDRFSLDLQGEVFFRDNEVKKDGLITVGSSSLEDTSTVAFMVNGILDMQVTDTSSFYLGAGAGWAPTVDLDSFSDGTSNFELVDDDGFAWQVKAGVDYDLGGAYSVQLGWRYFQTEDLLTEDDSIARDFDFENGTHALELSFRWSM